MTLSAPKGATQLIGQLCNIIFLASESWTWHTWLRSIKMLTLRPYYRNTTPSQQRYQHSTRDTLEHFLFCEWCLQQASSTFNTTDCHSKRNVCFQTPHIIGHLSRYWAIQGTQLQQKASGGKWMIFNLCQKFCVWAAGEQGKAFLGTKTWRDHWAGCAQAFAMQCTNTVQLYFTNAWGPCFPHIRSCKALVSEVKLCPLDDTVTFNKRPDAATVRCSKWRWHCFMCFVSAMQANCWKFPGDQRKQFTYLWEKGGAEPEPCFHSLEGKKKKNKTNPPSTFYSDCLIQCCDQHASVHKVSSKTVMPMDRK